ncbi:MAG: hypothetical protein HOC23_06650 [Halieaceae bacterium]|jgi:hypothetical protein|nr:hypothetical protein [Halieaceae bacterium]
MGMRSKLTAFLLLLASFGAGLSGCEMDSQPMPANTLTWTDFDRVRMSRMEGELSDLRTMLNQYYGGHAVLDHSWYLPGHNPSRKQGLAFLASKFARAVVWQDPLVIGTIGSSVVAGFDNCRYDCYQQQLQRTLGPVLATAGSRLEVRNSGQGGTCGDSFDNQIWCQSTLVGSDIDIAHYSWTYFESGQANKAVIAHEMFYRWSLMMDHAPSPQLIYANDCGKLQPREQTLVNAYAVFGADILCMTRGLAELGYQRREWGEMGDPLHSTSREGAARGTSELRRDSLAVMYRNWHPGPLLFQTTADVLAWRYSEALLLALEWISKEPDPKSRWPRKPTKLGLADLPPPLECPPEWCNVDRLPVCVNFEHPVFGKPDVALLAALERGWVFDPGRAEEQRAMPAEEKNLPQCRHPNRCSGWRVPPDQQAGALSFRLPALELGMVAVCCGSKGCGQKMLEAGAEFLIDGKKPVVAPQAHWADKCVQVQGRIPERDQASKSGGGQPVRLDITLPATTQPLPPITHVFGL